MPPHLLHEMELMRWEEVHVRWCMHVQTLDKGISRVKSILSSSCPSILRKDIIQFIRVLNSRLYSFLQVSKTSKFNSLLGNRPVSATSHTSSTGGPTLRDLTSRKVSNLFPAADPLTFFQLTQILNPFSDDCV